MAVLDEKHRATIDDAVGRLIAGAGNSRKLSADVVLPRIESALEKYLSREEVDDSQIRDFIDGIHIDDLCLVIACERGDEVAWRDLIINFDKNVKSAARQISSNTEDAEDLASSIWAELYGLRQGADGQKKSKLSYYSGRGSLAGWLRAIISQLAIDQFRRQVKYAQVNEERDFENIAKNGNLAFGDRNAAHLENPEDLYGEKQASQTVLQAVNNAVMYLQAEDKLILKLYYFDELKLKDIANIFGFHEATASRRLVRIQGEIRKTVETILRVQHGWSEAELKNNLSETASKIGFTLEKLFTVLTVIALLQEFYPGIVL